MPHLLLYSSNICVTSLPPNSLPVLPLPHSPSPLLLLHHPSPPLPFSILSGSLLSGARMISDGMLQASLEDNHPLTLPVSSSPLSIGPSLLPLTISIVSRSLLSGARMISDGMLQASLQDSHPRTLRVSSSPLSISPSLHPSHHQHCVRVSPLGRSHDFRWHAAGCSGL
ncbi:unnamed protein product [Closterium sp. NIES-53]